MSRQPGEASVNTENIQELLQHDQQNARHPHPASPPPSFLLPLNVAFTLCVVSHGLAAFYAPIQDCDETFNYWEPLHYLTHNYGLQTWEYSPEYSIRSWAYILLHFVPVKAASLLGKSKTFQFYLLRFVLAFFCAATETRLYAAVSKALNPRIGAFYLMVVAFSPGVFHASSAFLPSSFAMYTSTLALAAFIDHRGGLNTTRGIIWFATGALLGWPFAGALIIPFVIADGLRALKTNTVGITYNEYFDGALGCIAILGAQVVIDSAFYHKLVVVPWRIVSYNVLSGSDRGPDIFGTEPWHFYIRNLILNFNLWYALAMLVAPFLSFHYLFFGNHRLTQENSVSRVATYISPFYIWFLIFTIQPHKEERFMFPAYPFLALNAAIALHVLLTWFGNTDRNSITGKIPAKMRLGVALLAVLATVNIGLLRILGNVTAYRAPLQVYDALSAQTDTKVIAVSSNGTLCLGKEWYRFPSSHLLPDGIHAKFIQSAFDGLLPGEFAASSITNPDTDPSATTLPVPGVKSKSKNNKNNLLTSLRPGTHIAPPGMNDLNNPDPSKLYPADQCTYLIDSSLPSITDPSPLEPDFIAQASSGDTGDWDILACRPFLDAGATHVLARTIYVPDLRVIPPRFRRVWGRYCLLRRKEKR